MDKHDSFVHILYSINLDMEDTLDDGHASSDEESIDMDNYFPNMLFMQLTINSSDECNEPIKVLAYNWLRLLLC